ncbi:MAG TPA: hypothetical protein VGL93_24515 [Streptosporangiaceae bacterium]|jgi:hypothetical protein
MPPDDLTRVERRVWRAFATGEQVGLGDDRPGRDPERTVRAEVIAALLLSQDDPATRPGHDRTPAVRLAGARITGRLDLAGAEVPWLLSLYNCVLERPPDFSHAATRTIKINNSVLPGFAAIWARISGHLTLAESQVRGTVELTGTRVSGEVRMNDASIGRKGGSGSQAALSAGGLTVEGGCYGRGLRVRGGMRLAGARLRGGVVLSGAHLEDPDGTALDLENAEIANALHCSAGFTAHGTVRLRSARVAGRVSFRRARLTAPGIALHATRLRCDELDLHTAGPVTGEVRLSYSVLGTLADDSRTWPEKLHLNGMVYESLRHDNVHDDMRRRLGWLSRDPSGFRPQPYEQLAAFYRRLGEDNAARAILYAKQRLRPKRNFADRAFATVLQVTVGYGYRPQRAAAWLGGLLTLGSVAFALHHPAALKPDEAPHFNPVLYSLDLLSPIGGFGQRDAFDPVGVWQWLAGALVAAGWVLATALIAGVGRVYNRD